MNSMCVCVYIFTTDVMYQAELTKTWNGAKGMNSYPFRGGEGFVQWAPPAPAPGPGDWFYESVYLYTFHCLSRLFYNSVEAGVKL